MKYEDYIPGEPYPHFVYCLNENVSISKIGDDFLELSNGMVIKSHHDQDCCENVYADFSVLQLQMPIPEFDKILIKLVPDMGFLFNGMLVNCYNDQNGYYSSDLELCIGEDLLINISSACKNI